MTVLINLTQSQSLWMTLILILYMQILFSVWNWFDFYFFWLCGLINLRFDGLDFVIITVRCLDWLR